MGMMWFNNNPKTTFREKVIGGVEFFREKYKWEGLVEVRVRTIPDTPYEQIPKVNVEQMYEMIKHNFWIGIAEGDFRRDKEVVGNKDGENK